ncbi:hypothetical protein SteCoe_11471 [Stentor coeruleus]|uniref:Protein kinase domain-containing protein n=1 Tax=Stentor coeruleus TaxID=5963 RepID=A0A1R2CD41_9CILI|nr:hypothetical protein SteCoe_11471 [Stentor coeruleus]
MGCIVSTRTLKSSGKNIKKYSPIDKILTSPCEVSHKSVISDYMSLSCLGIGSFARVFRVHHIPSHSTRAMKVIKKCNLTHNQYTSNNTPQEIYILSKLNNPYTTNFFEYFEDKKQYYIITELCEGHNLYDHILEKGLFNEKMASIIIKKILQGLLYIHNLGIVHRDIKPENVLFSSPFNLDIKIADFGGSCEIKPGQKLKGIFGSKYYLAPEVLNGRYNEKVDIWSCGIMTYVIITGKAPYEDIKDDDISEVILKPFQLDDEKAKGFSEECKDFIEKMIRIDPEERMSAKDALKHKWFKGV